MTALAVLLAAVLVAVHLLAGRLRPEREVPRSRWLSIAGGISVSYVFVQLLPELARAAEEVESSRFDVLEHPIYLLALAGLAAFYGVERLARSSRRRQRERGHGDEPAQSATWFSFATYAVYNAVIGYVLVREQDTAASLVLFAVAMGVHFLVNDHHLSRHHEDDYRRRGRWVISAAILAGTGIALLTEIHPALIGALIAFIAGGVVLNVMKEELPEERDSSFGAFALGATAYAALLLLV